MIRFGWLLVRQRLNRLRKNSSNGREWKTRAKALHILQGFVVGLKPYANPTKQRQGLFPQPVKPHFVGGAFGTSEDVPKARRIVRCSMHIHAVSCMEWAPRAVRG